MAQEQQQIPMNKIAVLGNGKSLENFDFKSLKMDSIGLCLAYRHWNRIDWAPTYYCCIDHVVLKHNIEDIKDFIKKDKCKGYLLTRSCLSYWKEAEENDKIIFLEDFQNQPKNPFRYLKSWCTGTSAFLFSVILGYNDISLFGMDCNYTEFLPETEVLPDHTLRIKKTPTHNPNYFINDYQRKGDIYNKPNTDTVQRPSWEDIVFVLTGYTRLNNFMLNVYNFSIEGVDSLRDYFKTMDLSEFKEE
jgi:hypothetical protein